jgi:hypothetical protein
MREKGLVGLGLCCLQRWVTAVGDISSDHLVTKS